MISHSQEDVPCGEELLASDTTWLTRNSFPLSRRLSRVTCASPLDAMTMESLFRDFIFFFLDENFVFQDDTISPRFSVTLCHQPKDWRSDFKRVYAPQYLVEKSFCRWRRNTTRYTLERESFEQKPSLVESKGVKWSSRAVGNSFIETLLSFIIATCAQLFTSSSSRSPQNRHNFSFDFPSSHSPLWNVFSFSLRARGEHHNCFVLRALNDFLMGNRSSGSIFVLCFCEAPAS